MTFAIKGITLRHSCLLIEGFSMYDVVALIVKQQLIKNNKISRLHFQKMGVAVSYTCISNMQGFWLEAHFRAFCATSK